jgi:single-strand DNA-binding protein
MTDTIALSGLVATDPRHIITSEGLAITTFRLASTQRRFDRGQSKWVDGETNWYTITAFRQLALNSAGSIKKGERVVVTGRLRIREWQSGDRTGLNVDVEAESLGHDLAWGTTTFSRSISASTIAPSDDEVHDRGSAPDRAAADAPGDDTDDDPDEPAAAEYEPVAAADTRSLAHLPF